MSHHDLSTDSAAAGARYAAWGWPVLPLHSPTATGCSCLDHECRSPAKHPRLARGVHRASTARAQVAGWWQRWPEANVAIATGAIVVLDVDGADGARSLQALEANYQRLPDTAWVSTARGRHLYFLALGLELGNSAGRAGSGLDIRGRGGFVVAPPSLHHTGWRYRWHDLDVGLAAVPSWLAESLRPARRVVSEVELRAARGDAYVRAAVDGELDRIASSPPHTRNDTVNRAAFRLGQLAGAGLVDPEALVDPLLVAALAVGQGEREARATIASGLTAGVANPRRVRRRTRTR
jgi:hypothetical protein